MARPAYKTLPGPSVVSSGSVSKPKKPRKWRPSLDPLNATPRVVKAD
jgi:hypothetical protein